MLSIRRIEKGQQNSLLIINIKHYSSQTLKQLYIKSVTQRLGDNVGNHTPCVASRRED